LLRKFVFSLRIGLLSSGKRQPVFAMAESDFCYL